MKRFPMKVSDYWFRAYLKKPPLRERVGVRASDRRRQSRKAAAIRATLTPDPSPAERARGDYGIGSYTRLRDLS